MLGSSFCMFWFGGLEDVGIEGVVSINVLVTAFSGSIIVNETSFFKQFHFGMRFM